MKRAVAAGTAVAALLLAGACGSGGGDDPAVRAPAAPGASVEPSSNNVITGPINQAKRVAGQQEQHDQQLERTATTGG
mgnify:CR=1 FL=1